MRAGVSGSVGRVERVRLEGTERALREREITFAALAKVAPVGIMRFDAAGRCNYVNDRWSQIAAMSIDDAVGNGWQRAIHREDRPHVVHRWNLLRLQEEIFREEYRVCRPDESIRWVLAEGVPLRSYSGRLLGFIRAVTDITEHRQLEADLSAARADLEDRVRKRTAELEAQIRERERLEKQVLDTKDAEQRRFSEDLHDGLGQYLTGVLFRVEALEHDLRGTNPSAAADAGKIAELVHQTINQAHDLARGVQPVAARGDGLVLALQELERTISDAGIIGCSFDCAEPVYVDDPGVAAHVYRIAQESVTNAIKHSAASHITVALGQANDAADLVVRDNGKGFDPAALSAKGNGVSIMKHRAQLIGGKLEISSRPGGGTTIFCRFPVTK